MSTAAQDQTRASADGPTTAGAAARTGAQLIAATAVLMLSTYLTSLLPSSAVNVPAPVVVMLLALLPLALALYYAGPECPWWTLHAVCATCTIGITAGIVQVSALASQIAALYVLVVLFASYYFSRRGALAHVVACTALATAALRLAPSPDVFPSPLSVQTWLPIVGIIAISGGFLTTVRRQREGLVEEQRELQDRLEATVRTDALTGLLNRHGFEAQAGDALADIDGTRAAVIVADLDDFKTINDAHGHATGDRALRRVADVISQRSRRLDIVGRTGGGDFAILAPQAEVSDAVALAERLRRDVMLAFGDEPFSPTMSIGVAIFPRDGETLDELLIAADRAVHTAKKTGGNRTMLAAEAAGAIEADAAREDNDLDERARLITAIGLAEALDLRDTGTASHSQTVARYAADMAQELGLDARRIERIRVAGMLHDIGKIGVPDSILNKPDKLTDDEYSEMKRHPEIGARILGSDVLDDVRSWVLAHHERPDGRGYPFGLEGEQVPLEARILSVADAYEAMTSDRVYRSALSDEVARAELERCRGTQFDPDVIDAFLIVLDRAQAVEVPTPLAA